MARFAVCVTALAVLAAVTSRGQSAGSATAAASAATREVVDETGRRVLVPAQVRRIVSLAPNQTEIVYALGADDRLAGVTDYCDYPPEAKTKPRVGGAVNPSLERILAMKPDLILAQANQLNRRETVEALERLGVAVFASDSRSVDGALASIEHVAGLIGAAVPGRALVEGLRERLAALARRLGGRPARRVLFVVWDEPLISVGRNTFLADALARGGAQSVVDTPQDWPRLNLEEVMRLQPDYLVFASSHSEDRAHRLDALRDRRGWRTLEAVQQGRVVVISDAVNRPSPRLVDAIEELARQLHPDAFETNQENGKGKRENRKPLIESRMWDVERENRESRVSSRRCGIEFRFSLFPFPFSDFF